MILVQHILNSKGRKTWTVETYTSVFEALQLMAEENIGALVVLEQGRLAGIFSERDYARKVVLSGRSSKATPVGDLMTTPVVSVAPTDSVDHCMALMTENRIRHLPVLEAEKLSGVVSIGDVVKAVISDQADTIRKLEGYITQG